MKNNQKFTTVITSKHRVFDLHIKETWKYRDLIMLFVKRDFISLYKQTVLGPLWAIIQPLLTTIVFTVVFGSLAGLDSFYDIALPSGTKIPSILFFMSGTICWQYFANTLNMTSNTFIHNRGTMGKVYYPRLVSPVATTISGLISFTIQFVMFIGFWLYFLLAKDTIMEVTPNLLFIPLVVLQLMLLSSGCGIIISSVTTKYRDLAMLVGFGLQLWQYASPIAYGLTLVTEKIPNLTWLYMLNPVTPIITTFRYSVFGIGYFDLTYYLIGWLITVFIFFLGLILFSRIERTFTDTI